MSDRTSFPLTWPENWPRTAPGRRQSSRFTSSGSSAINDAWRPKGRKSMEEARQFLAAELARLGARKEILSTNVKLRIDGAPYSGQAQPSDPGAAVYFELKGRPVSLACDKWNRVEDNIYAIAKHIEALRGQERWGVGSIEQAFRGYMALPGIGESSAMDWWKVLGVPVNSTEEQVKSAFRLLAMKHHPDKGGDPELFRRLTAAWDQFRATQPQTEKPA